MICCRAGSRRRCCLRLRLPAAAIETRTGRAGGSARCGHSRAAPRPSTSPRKLSAKPNPSPAPPSSAAAIGPFGSRCDELFDKRQALLDFTDAYPDASIDIARRQYRNDKVEFVDRAHSPAFSARRNCGRWRVRHSRGRRTAVQVRRKRSRSRRYGPAAKRCCRRARRGAEIAAGWFSANRPDAAAPPEPRSVATPPGTTRSIINRCPKQVSAARSTRSRRMPQCAFMSENEASLQMAPMSPK